MKYYLAYGSNLNIQQMAVRSAKAEPNPNENHKYAMRTWLLRLGFIGEEFATARDILTRRLAGDSSWADGVRRGSRANRAA